MAGLIPRHFIDDLLVRIDIVELIDSHLPLKKTGSNYSALCPFHNEKSPSFTVNRKKQFFYCFGCGVGGNVISFLMDYSNLEFIEAIEELAAFIGIDVSREQGNYAALEKHDNLKVLYFLLEKVAKFYAVQLKTNAEAQKAVDYLKLRGVSGIVARDFMLGYAVDGWNELSQHFENTLLFDVGLLTKKDSGQSYDRFRGRLMFPIRDKRGRILGFGARVLDDSLPKYLNSPETVIFSKSNEVYGLYELLQQNSKPERILIVEGYMDVIALAQFGIHYAVATLGTATSKKLLDVLFRYSSELVFCFDGDKAGIKAAWRAVEMAMPSLKDGRQIKVMLLPQGEDPDSLIRQEGLDSFLKRILLSQVLSEYFFEHVTNELDLATMEGRSKLVSTAQTHLQQLPEGVFKHMMQSKLQGLSELPERELTKFLEVSENTATLKRETRRGTLKKSANKLTLTRFTIALLLQNPHLVDTLVNKIPYWDEFYFRGLDVLKNMVRIITDHKPVNMGALIECYRGSNEEKIINTLATYELGLDITSKEMLEQIFVDGMNNLIKQAKDIVLSDLLYKESCHSISIVEKQRLMDMLK
ncbi:MAG: DNA primase [Methylococcales bacterium]|nr:DNA primase [Methylococcales bacterium]